MNGALAEERRRRALEALSRANRPVETFNRPAGVTANGGTRPGPGPQPPRQLDARANAIASAFNFPPQPTSNPRRELEIISYDSAGRVRRSRLEDPDPFGLNQRQPRVTPAEVARNSAGAQHEYREVMDGLMAPSPNDVEPPRPVPMANHTPGHEIAEFFRAMDVTAPEAEAMAARALNWVSFSMGDDYDGEPLDPNVEYFWLNPYEPVPVSELCPSLTLMYEGRKALVADLAEVPYEASKESSSPEEGEARSKSPDSVECIVCLVKLSDGDAVKYLPCRHVFHSACIDEWIMRSPKCPMCKLDLEESRS